MDVLNTVKHWPNEQESNASCTQHNNPSMGTTKQIPVPLQCALVSYMQVQRVQSASQTTKGEVQDKLSQVEAARQLTNPVQTTGESRPQTKVASTTKRISRRNKQVYAHKYSQIYLDNAREDTTMKLHGSQLKQCLANIIRTITGVHKWKMSCTISNYMHQSE